MSKDITESRVWSTKQVIVIVSFFISVTFSGTLIYSRFLFNEEQIQVVSDRLEKKTKRIEEDNLKQWEMINLLLTEKK